MSKNKIEIYSDVKEGGKFQKNAVVQIVAFLVKCIGKRVQITIEVVKNTRSHRQNRYLHLLFTIFKNELNELGNEFTMEEIKELCKAKFAMIDVVNKDSGEVIGQRIKGTHEMTKGEMVEFIDKIIAWAADSFHIILPYPSEQFGLELE